VIFVDDDVYDNDHYEFYQMLYFSVFLVRPSKFNKQQQQQQQQQQQEKCIKKENSASFVCQIWRYVLCFFSCSFRLLLLLSSSCSFKVIRNS
jgi:hypothetical protein